MKINKLTIMAAVFWVIALPLQPTEAYTDVSVQVNAVGDFYEPLSSYGTWVEVGSYGRCWYPASVHQYWRPYCYGSWVWTDDGWYWVSDEPWAWATYHYGRWVWDSRYGWLWVPATVWAPAWVSFRTSDTYVGWAPLPPGCDFGPRGVIVDVWIPPLYFVFVEHRRFCDRISPSVVVVDEKIVHKTVNVTKIKVVNKTVINEGPAREEIEKRSGVKVREAKVSELRAQTPPRPAPRQQSEPKKPAEPRKSEDVKTPEASPPPPRSTVTDQPRPVPSAPPSEERIKGEERKESPPPDRPWKKFQRRPYREMPPEAVAPKPQDQKDQNPRPAPSEDDGSRGQDRKDRDRDRDR